MSYEQVPIPPITQPEPLKRRGRYSLHLLLFLLTFFTTALAGVSWANKDPFELANFSAGLTYAGAILFILGCHEFGHYFAGRYHGVKTTLPYFIPFPPVPFLLNFGTLGAVIRTRSVVPSRKVMFDIGVSGPIAGLVACLMVLIAGFQTLPGPDYILAIHPNFDFKVNADPTVQGIPLEFGQTILYKFLAVSFTDPQTQFVPPMTEIYHYPLLCVGWFGLFVTAMNLIPIGQFDGGHIIYTMFGDQHRRIAQASFAALLILGLPSVLDSFLGMLLSLFSDSSPAHVIPFVQYSWSGWFIWALISFYVVKLVHPPVPDETPLDNGRMIIGWLSIAVFFLCFSFMPFSISI